MKTLLLCLSLSGCALDMNGLQAPDAGPAATIMDSPPSPTDDAAVDVAPTVVDAAPDVAVQIIDPPPPASDDAAVDAGCVGGIIIGNPATGGLCVR
jgi:hypothetical protein